MCEERHSQMRPGHVKLVRDEEGRTGEENGSGEGWEWGGEGLAGCLAMAGNLQERCDGRKTRQRRASSQAGASRFAGPLGGSGVGKAALGTWELGERGLRLVTRP